MSEVESAPNPSANPATRLPGSRRRALLVVVVVAAGLSAAAGFWYLLRPSPPPDPPEVDLTEADPDVAEAVRQAREAVVQSPRSGKAWGKLGTILAAHDFRVEALACLAEAQRLDPRELRWPYLQGVTLQLGDPERAVPKLREAAELAGPGTVPQLRLAEALLSAGQVDEAETLFDEARRHEPDNPRILLGLGQVALARGRFTDSLAPLQAAAEHPRAQKRAHVLLAEAYAHIPAKQADAERERARSARLPEDPPWPDSYVEEALDSGVGKLARLERANRLRHQGRGADALALLRDTTVLYPDSYQVWLSFGTMLLDARDHRGAEQALRTATRCEPHRSAAYFFLGAALYRQRRERPAALAEAADAYRAAIRLTPTDARFHFALALCLEESGTADARLQALAAYRAAARHRPDYADAHRNLGRLLADAGREAEAALLLQHVVACPAVDLAVALRALALFHLRFAVQAAPADHEAREALARLRAEFPTSGDSLGVVRPKD
jgi:tetratricopeptide (TPR) repeat protein